jgi:cellulose synthase/poly-beta-1,6-N-acetylglucosamine synthase-like glycosyltransferase
MSKSRKRGASWKSGRINADVSLIVATYNEEATLPTKLKNILEQDFPKQRLELVIVDSGSTDGTPGIVEEFVKQNHGLKTVFIRERERLGKSHALNVAYPRASGVIKIISDSDAILDKSALSRIVNNFFDETVGAACGRQVLLNADENPSTRLEKSYRGIYGVLREGESIVDSTPIFHGELSAYRARLIDPLPENKSADDSRLANIIRIKGFRSVYDSGAVFYEYAPPNFRSRIIQKVRRGQGLIRVFWDFKGHMFRKRYGKYGLLILPMEFFMHVVFPSLWIIFLVSFSVSLALYSWVWFAVLGVLVLAVLGLSRIGGGGGVLGRVRGCVNLAMSFVSSQALLFYALLLWVSGRSLHKWQKVDDIRKEWKPDK